MEPNKTVGVVAAADILSWDECLAQFRAACRSAKPPAIPAIRDWLGRVCVEEQPHVLVDLVAEHLRGSWETGNGTQLEAYATAFADCSSVADLPADLVEQEFIARHEFPGSSDHPSLDDYAQRFPGRSDVLEALRARCLDGGRYVKIKVEGEGGLGLVWSAYDQHLKRHVAIKEPQPEVAGYQQILRRLADEARVTAGLEHPAIVSVHEYRPASDDLPFYVMRLVHGRTLRTVIRDYHRSAATVDAGERCLLWNDLLRAFITVCDAVAYAHSRGVLHRDLKPHNVVVGEFGETVVLDWGLAKERRPNGSAPVPAEGVGLSPDQPRIGDTPIDQRGMQTPASAAVGTFQYMSPEQAKGFTDERSDIFSLGAILYELLTGRPPYTEEAPAVLAKVEAADYMSPRQLRSSIPQALEEVCLKALARDPAQRYASAKELGREVSLFLADEPVSAWREPWMVRMRRRLKRHRTVVAAATASLCVALVGLALATVLLTEANQELLAANVREHQATATAEANYQHAEQRKREAEAATERERAATRTAEANYQLAREAVDQFRKKVADNPRLKTGGLRNLRRELLEEAGKFYAQFIEQHGNDPGLQKDLADACFKSALLAAELGANPQAIERYQQARTLLDKLVAAYPDVSQYQRDLAGAYNNLALVQDASDQRKAALQSFERARTLEQKLVAANPDVPDYQNRLASSYHNLGVSQRAFGQHDAALRSYEQARDLGQKLVTAYTDVPKYQNDLASTYSSLGVLQDDRGQHDAALQSFGQARTLQEKLGTTYPDVLEYQRDLARTYYNLAFLQKTKGQPDAALKSCEQARVLQDKLVAAHPDVPDYQKDLADTYNKLGDLQSKTDQREAALSSYQQARILRERLVNAHPDHSAYQNDLAGIYNNLANLHRDTDQHDAALHFCEQALTLQRRLVAAHPDARLYQSYLGNIYENLGSLQEKTGQRDAALKSYEEARTIRAKLVAAHPDFPEYQNHLANSCNSIGILQKDAGQREVALQSYEQARAIWERLVAAHPDVPDYQIRLGGTYVNLGSLVADNGKPEDSLLWYAKAISLIRQHEPSNSTARLFLRNAYLSRARALSNLSRHAEALKDWDRTLALETGPDRNRLRLECAKTLAYLGQHAQASAEANDLAQAKGMTAGNLYNLACVYALSSAAAAKDASLPQADRNRLAERHAARAVELLTQVQATGYFKDRARVERLKKDSDLDPLRSRDDFQKLLAELEAKAK
jgi:serine/threonine protein kinase